MTKQQIKILDEIWSFAVKERDGFRCRRCGATKRLNSHHIIKRQFKALRWDVDNGITLCIAHHTFGNDAAHVDEIGFLEWLNKENIDYNKLRSRRLNRFEKTFEEILNEFKETYKNVPDVNELISKRSKAKEPIKRKKLSRKVSNLTELINRASIQREDVIRFMRIKEPTFRKIEEGRKTLSPAKLNQLAFILKCKKEDLK